MSLTVVTSLIRSDRMKWSVQAVPTVFASVLPSANPITGTKKEVFEELVQGLSRGLAHNHEMAPMR